MNSLTARAVAFARFTIPAEASRVETADDRAAAKTGAAAAARRFAGLKPAQALLLLYLLVAA